ncbi:hybrid sensor histidine kinase/response regulator, partial [Pseudomonas sp. FW305-BF6]
TLVQGITGLLRSSLGPSVSIETRFAPELEPVMADVNQLELAVLNLATNARDAMPDGGKLLISARMEEVYDQTKLSLAAGRYVCLSVT